MLKRILILGASGMLGKPVVTHLVKDGFQVRILVRNTEKAKGWLDESVEVYQGDVADKESIQFAMKDCNGVHISIGGAVDQISAEIVSNLAPKLGVEQITYISGATVAEKNRWFPMVAQKLNAETAIRSSGVPYTIFCPTWPMEQLPRFARNGKPSLIGAQRLPVHFFAAEDLARMVSKAYQIKTAQNKRFFIYGPEAMTMKAALKRYCTVFHPEVTNIFAMPVWFAKLMGAMTGNETLKFAAGLMGYFNRTSEIGDPIEANQILGKPLITLESWLEARR